MTSETPCKTESANRETVRDAHGRFAKGTAPGPGRGHGPILLDVLAKQLDPDMLAKALIARIKKGDLGAITYAYDRLIGRPGNKTELTGAEGGPVELKWGNDQPA